MTSTPPLARASQQAREAYMARLADRTAQVPWWTAVILTASSALQAGRYRDEMQRRLRQGAIPAGVIYLAVPDIEDQRIGSGGATLQALRQLVVESGLPANGRSLTDWWASQRVLMIHSGGDSRRLPQYSAVGKLFSALPVKTPWHEVSTVFDEMLALSTGWAARLPAGLLVSSGDVVLTFDPAALAWDQPGVAGVAMRQPPEVGAQHGVYVTDEQGRVYAFLQKPSKAQVASAGGLLPGDLVAVDTGLLRFDAPVATLLTELAGIAAHGNRSTAGPGIQDRTAEGLPVIDLYQHITGALTGQWRPDAAAHPSLHRLADALRDIPFSCSVVDGDFTHIGTTTLFRELMTGDHAFRQLYDAHQQVGRVGAAEAGGLVVDSVLGEESTLALGAMALECHLDQPVQAGRGAILHGLAGLRGPVVVPAETVVHQVPVRLPDGARGTVARIYSVADDPRVAMDQEGATWLAQPWPDIMAALAIGADDLWPESEERSLWHARLFPLTDARQAWECAQWFLGQFSPWTADRWRAATRLSLAESARHTDLAAAAEHRIQRLHAGWCRTAVSLARAGADLRPLLVNAPGIAALTQAGRELTASAQAAADLTEAASMHVQASRFLGQAGLVAEADAARTTGFRCVHQAVERGTPHAVVPGPHRATVTQVVASAPVRIDMGGGWSDTPPFCLDWGGAVLNVAVTIDGENPVRTTVRRVDEPVLRLSSDDEPALEYYSPVTVNNQLGPTAPHALVRAALRLAGLDDPRRTGGLDVRTRVGLPVGSGLGTSSILGATLVQALSMLDGSRLTPEQLQSQVMRLEQLLTTGGGWQDQAGGIWPGAKLILSGPGLHQRLRIQPVIWSAARQADFQSRFVLYYTGIRRMARNLLAQIVGSYLARETRTVQVLHSIKTLALEMTYALQEGEWDYLGELLDRHWQLNRQLDANTTNPLLETLLRELRPHLAGAKLAGAGGGGFLMLLARDPDAAAHLRAHLRERSGGGQLYDYQIAADGLQAVAERQ